MRRLSQAADADSGDCGLSCRELFRRMRQVGEEPETLDAILITHEHSDTLAGWL